jgi:hypothetical protein
MTALWNDQSDQAKQMRNEVLAQFNYSTITAPFSVVDQILLKEGDNPDASEYRRCFN